MSYATRAEVDAIIAITLASTDERRIAWNAASEADQDIAIANADDDLDAVHYCGSPYSQWQNHQWPRYRTRGSVDGLNAGTMINEPALALPDGISSQESWSLAGLPAGVRKAHAIQAARNAFVARGFDPIRQIQQESAAGITSRSAGGGSIGVDAAKAGTPMARIDADAQRHLSRFVRTGFGGVG